MKDIITVITESIVNENYNPHADWFQKKILGVKIVNKKLSAVIDILKDKGFELDTSKSILTREDTFSVAFGSSISFRAVCDDPKHLIDTIEDLSEIDKISKSIKVIDIE